MSQSHIVSFSLTSLKNFTYNKFALELQLVKFKVGDC